MSEIKNLILENLGVIIGVIVSYIALILPIIKYLQDKRREEKNKRFENYHKLIKELVDANENGENPKIDRQIAVAFELRNFKEYYPVTKRILEGLKNLWCEKQNASRLIDEINLTLNYIDLSWFCKKIAKK
jgi:hypothetical protein